MPYIFILALINLTKDNNIYINFETIIELKKKLLFIATFFDFKIDKYFKFWFYINTR